MSVVSVNEIHNGRDGESEGRGGRGVYRYTRVFRVVTNSNTDDGVAVQNGLYASKGIRLGVAHPTHASAHCQRVSPRNESFSKKVWLVTCLYSSERELSENPVNMPAQVDWSTEQFTRPYFRDRDGYGIMNSAGDYYDPPVDGDDSRWVAHVEKNVAATPSWLRTYRDAVNSDAFTLDGLSIQIGEAKLMEMNISRWKEWNGYDYRTVNLTIAIDENGWGVPLLDQGLQEIGSTSTARVHIKDDDGDLVDAPVLLNGSGKRLVNPTPATAVFRTHYIYKSLPFSVLPLS